MYRGYKSHIIAICFLFPKNRTNKIFLTKNLIAYFFEVVYLIIINGNKNHTIFIEQIPCQQMLKMKALRYIIAILILLLSVVPGIRCIGALSIVPYCFFGLTVMFGILVLADGFYEGKKNEKN